MKRSLFLIAFTLLVGSSMLLTSCSKSGAPNCSDSDVTSLVIDIANDKLKDQLLLQGMLQLEPSESKGLNAVSQLYQATPTYEHWNNLKNENNAIKKVVDYVDRQVSELDLGLSGIRTNDTNDKARKCKCTGELTSSKGKGTDIDYTAQYTDDGQIYVEVFGL